MFLPVPVPAYAAFRLFGGNTGSRIVVASAYRSSGSDVALLMTVHRADS